MYDVGSHNNEPPRPFAQHRDRLNYFLWFCAIHVRPLEAILLRRLGTAGEKYFSGLATALALPYLLLFGITFNAPLLMTGIAVYYLVVLIFHRVHRVRRESQGRYCHSLYVGDSRLSSDWKTAQFREAWGMLGLGCVAMIVSEALGWYLIIAGFALAILSTLQQARMTALRRARRDALIEQRILYEEEER